MDRVYSTLGASVLLRCVTSVSPIQCCSCFSTGKKTYSVVSELPFPIDYGGGTVQNEVWSREHEILVQVSFDQTTHV